MTHTITPRDSKYGWKRDLPDHRDHILNTAKVAPLPPSVDLRAGMPPVYDQGQLGSCTGNAIAAAFDYERKRQAEPFVNPSRLFIYYNERAIEHTTRSDAGANIRDGIKSVNATGVCPESEWPYDIAKFARKPANKCYADAIKTHSIAYQSVQRAGGATDVMTALAQTGPVVFGFSVFASFESRQVAATGIVPMPSPNEQMVGGHAVVAVGYDQNQQMFTVRNSWGAAWGDAGYFRMPFAYLADPNLASDLWCISLVS